MIAQTFFGSISNEYKIEGAAFFACWLGVAELIFVRVAESFILGYILRPVPL